MATTMTAHQIAGYDILLTWDTQNMHVNGWNATNEITIPNVSSDNQAMEYETTSIDVGTPTSGDCMYFGLKATTETDPTIFRQICIPLIDGELPPHLQAP